MSRAVACSVTALIAVLWPGSLLAQTPPADESLKAECAQAYAETQRLSQAGKQLEALEKAVFCAQPTCPSLLHADCTRWVSELEASIPTIVLEARDGDGNPLLDVSVSIDGRPVAERLEGRALRLNPGEHVFRFEHAGQSLERRSVVLEGAKSQRLLVDFPSQARRSSDPERQQQAGVHPGVWVAGGLAVVGLAGFAYFGLKGNASYDELEQRCAPRCTDDELGAVRRDWLIADVSLGLGAVSLGALGWLLLSNESAEAAPAALAVSPRSATVHYRTRF